MRLGQFSRKYEVKSSEIVEILDKHFRTVNNHPNIKLTSEELSYLLNQFEVRETEEGSHLQDNATDDASKTDHATASLPETAIDADAEENQIIAEDTALSDPQLGPNVEGNQPNKADASTSIPKETPKVISLEKEYEEQTKGVETIKTEKPKLDGLKVLGKIAIPEPKEKNKIEEKTESLKKKGEERTTKKRHPRKSQKQTLSLEEQRKRKERLAWKKKQQEQKRLKEKRRAHYEKQLAKKKEVQKAKKLHKKKETTIAQVPSPKEKITPHVPVKKNPLKRFWKWLNGAYDET